MTIIMELSFINWNTVYYFVTYNLCKKNYKNYNFKKTGFIIIIIIKQGLTFFYWKEEFKRIILIMLNEGNTDKRERRKNETV